MLFTVNQNVIIFFLSLFAGIVNTLSGGGSLIIIPLLISMGIPPQIANGSNRIAILFQTFISTSIYHQKKQINYKTVVAFALPSVLGCFIGASIVCRIPDQIFKFILSSVLILVSLWLVFGKYNYYNLQKTKKVNMISILFFFIIGIYGGFLQGGVGYLILMVLNIYHHYSLQQANIYKVVIAFIYTSIAVVVFMVHGQINWVLGLLLACGNGLGGLIGAHINLKSSEQWLRLILLMSLIFLAIKMLII